MGVVDKLGGGNTTSSNFLFIKIFKLNTVIKFAIIGEKILHIIQEEMLQINVDLQRFLLSLKP